ncbi:hypothetical protein [Actinomadura parmotrematis]|uniref:Lipoprotein n=1 Tax=Actinomadura parmotrematis TaxID=2864039 RepID=A0ABS7G091_9ACTN|nr:hypothetical protein [Actinomadura parmotrematis]MBW8486126.1 hypothetical protein [Actinomadura parmotrematis]
MNGTPAGPGRALRTGTTLLVSALMLATCAPDLRTAPRVRQAAAVAGHGPARPVAAHARTLSLPLIGTLTARFAASGQCGGGGWRPGHTAVDEPYRSQTLDARGYHCAHEPDAVTPGGEQQALFLVFRTSAQARAYVRAQAALAVQAVGYLQDRQNVLEIDAARLPLDRMRLLRDVRDACGGCGTLTTSWEASGQATASR